MRDFYDKIPDDVIQDLNDAVQVAAGSGMNVSDIATLIADFRRIELPSPGDGLKARAEAGQLRPHLEGLIASLQGIAETGFSVQSLAAILDVDSATYIADFYELLGRAIEHLDVDLLPETVDPRSRLIALMMADAGSEWFNSADITFDTEFVTTVAGLQPKAGSAISFVVDAVSAVHDVSVEDYHALVPQMEAALGAEFLREWNDDPGDGKPALTLVK